MLDAVVAVVVAGAVVVAAVVVAVAMDPDRRRAQDQRLAAHW